MKLSEIAEKIQGKLCGENIDISGLSGLDNPVTGTIAFAENKKNLEALSSSNISAILIKRDMVCNEKPSIQCDDPKLCFGILLGIFSTLKPYPQKVFPEAFVAPSALIGNNVTILPFAVIMDGAKIGDNTVIYSNVFIGKEAVIGENCLIKSGVVIDDQCIIGNKVIIHPNSVIGGDGFGYIQRNGKNIKIPQIGKIRIEDDVEIGACVTIDRATIGETLISENVKIDNLVQIAHNVKIGSSAILVSQVGIAGSSSVGKNSILAGQVGVADHIEIGDNVTIMAQSGVEDRKIDSGSIIFGTPARNFMDMKRIYSAQARLPELLKRVKTLEDKVLPSSEKTKD